MRQYPSGVSNVIFLVPWKSSGHNGTGIDFYSRKSTDFAVRSAQSQPSAPVLPRNVHWLNPFIHPSIHSLISKSSPEWLLCSQHSCLGTGVTAESRNTGSAIEWQYQWKGYMDSQLHYNDLSVKAKVSTRHYAISELFFLCLKNKIKKYTASLSFTSHEQVHFSLLFVTVAIITGQVD